jgi:hypothetical protein
MNAAAIREGVILHVLRNNRDPERVIYRRCGVFVDLSVQVMRCDRHASAEKSRARNAKH